MNITTFVHRLFLLVLLAAARNFYEGCFPFW